MNSTISEQTIKEISQWKADWEESEHPRHENGMFAPKGTAPTVSAPNQSAVISCDDPPNIHDERSKMAYRALSEQPIAEEYLPLRFMSIDDIGELQLDTEKYSKEDLEKIPGIWEVNTFAIANDAYWNADDEHNAGDTDKYSLINGGYINDEDDLDKWGSELDKKYPDAMAIYFEDADIGEILKKYN
jgi:hypothetical protein